MGFTIAFNVFNKLLVCDWPHFVFGQNHLFVKMLLNRDFTIQKHSR
jgi:hypothetical protein